MGTPTPVFLRKRREVFEGKGVEIFSGAKERGKSGEVIENARVRWYEGGKETATY